VVNGENVLTSFFILPPGLLTFVTACVVDWKDVTAGVNMQHRRKFAAS
jgi:hypothetical protein